MKFLIKFAVVVLSIVIGFSCSPESMDGKVDLQTSESNIPVPTAFELEILDLLNVHRVSLGLMPLKSLDIIRSQTDGHTHYMAKTQTLSHDYFYERSQFLKKNAAALKVSENVAFGYSSAEGLVKAWINSDHHKVIIEGDYTHFNLSAEKGTDSKWYFTNIFIKR